MKDKDYIEAMRRCSFKLYIKSLQMEIDSIDRDIEESKQMIILSEKQRDLAYTRLNKANRDLNLYNEEEN